MLVYMPDDSGLWPLVMFLPGFQLSVDLYKLTLERVASHGFVVVGAQPPASLLSVSHVEMTSDALAVLDWAQDPKGPIANKVDPSRVGMSGHSLGGKLSVMAAFRDPRIRAVITLDPVNGGNPISGYSEALPDIVPDQVAPLTIPLGFVGEDWSATHASFGQPCAPPDQNYKTFYAAATLALWKARWTFGGADHMDFVDNPGACGFTCSVCPDGPGDDASQVAGARTLLVAFFRRHLNGELGMEKWLTGDLVPTVVTELDYEF